MSSFMQNKLVFPDKQKKVTIFHNMAMSVFYALIFIVYDSETVVVL